MLTDYLVRHAKENVWCTPFQDRQSILKLTQITRQGGEFGFVNVLWETIALPTLKDKYHVYQVGQNSFQRMAWPALYDKWIQLSYWGEVNNQIIDFYLNRGIHLPLSCSYIRRTRDDNYIIATKLTTKLWNLDKELPYLRCYRNSFFDSDRSDYLNYKVGYGGGLIDSINYRAQLQKEIATYRREDGIVNVYLNGVWVDDIQPERVKLGDYVEYVYDGAVTRVVDFKISNLPDFMSDLDKVKKYLLHPAKEDTEETIRYRDDVDFYLYKKVGAKGYEGRYYHRNMENSARMVTHWDYSIPVQTVNAYIANDDKWVKYEDLYLRLHIRDSGYDRPLINEHHRIKELYRLSDNEIINAMLGIDAVLDEWKVNSLESSMYTAIMRDLFGQFGVREVLQAYGYNSVSKLVADSPLKVIENVNGNYVEMGPGLQTGCTMYEYDADGLLLGHIQVPYGTRYYPYYRDQCKLVDAIVGLGQKQLDWQEGNSPVTLPSEYLYRLYVSPKKKDIVTNQWSHAVEGVNYTLNAGVVTWIHNPNGFQGLLLTDKYFLADAFDYASPTDVYQFNITHSNTKGVDLPIQPEVLYIWANGNELIENLDYYIQWPVVTVVSKKHLRLNGESNHFDIRGIGFCDENMQRRQTKDQGFVNHGLVSLNGHYDTRDDKVMHSIVGGRLYHPDDIPFAENAERISGLTFENGLPYKSQQLPVSIRGLSPEVNDLIRELSRDVDNRLEDYLTLKYPEPKFTTPSPILDYYYLYSPLLTRLYFDISKGYLTPPFNPDDYEEVNRKMQPYLGFLPYEPARNSTNPNYVRLIAHPYDTVLPVTELVYRFFDAVNKFYLNQKLTLNHHFSIKGNV